MTLQIAPVRAVTSASNLLRRKLCPGSARMEMGLGEEENEYSAEGTFLHSQFMQPKSPDATPDQLETLALAEYYADRHFDRIRRQFNIPEDAEYIDEKDVGFWLYDNKGHPIIPGHSDRIRNWPKYLVRSIVDAKFGFLDVEHAADNTQLASYFVMAHQQIPVAWTGVCIVQPRNFGPRMSEAIYSAGDFAAARDEIILIDKESKQPDAPLRAGRKQCHFCKAKSICDEYKRTFITLRTPMAVETLENEDLSKLHTAIAAAIKLQPLVNSEMRRRISEGKLPGYKLRNTGDHRVCVKPSGLYMALSSYFADNPDFTARAYDACREIAWGKLAKFVQSITNMSEKASKKFVKEISEPFCTSTPKEKAVVRADTEIPEIEE